MAPSPELTTYTQEADQAAAACAKAISDAMKLPIEQERDDALEAAQKKLKEDLKKAKEKYKKALEAAAVKFKELLNAQIEKFQNKKETNMKPVIALYPSVSEAAAFAPYNPAKDCKKKDNGDCTPSTDAKGVYHCDEGKCKCHCRVYINIGGMMLLAEKLIHGATFKTCPDLSGFLGGGTMQCKCVEE